MSGAEWRITPSARTMSSHKFPIAAPARASQPALMKLILLAFAVLLTPFLTDSMAAEANRETLRIPKGRLGLPFKTKATLEVEVVRAEDVGKENLVGDYLLRVLRVDSVELKSKPVFQFKTAAGVPPLPDDVFTLYKLKTGKDVEEIPEEELKRVEEGFVGKKLTYQATEIEGVRKAAVQKEGGKAPESTLLLSSHVEQP